MNLLELILKFCVQFGVNVEPGVDNLGNSVWSLARNDRMSLEKLMQYYSEETIMID